MPAVTAIITTFNRRKFLGPAIQSVLGQTFGDFELLILDNSSTDGSEELVREFSDRRLRYIKHPAMGISPQRNLGLAEARGEFVAFLDDDDEWLPRKLELELDLFRRGPVSLALTYGGLKWIDTDGRV